MAVDVALVVPALTAAAVGVEGVATLVPAGFVVANSEAVEVPRSWLRPLGLVKLTAAVGLTLGLAGVSLLGTAAAVGLCLYFVGAVVAHLRVGDRDLRFPGAFLALSAGSLLVLWP